MRPRAESASSLSCIPELCGSSRNVLGLGRHRVTDPALPDCAGLCLPLSLPTCQASGQWAAGVMWRTHLVFVGISRCPFLHRAAPAHSPPHRETRTPPELPIRHSLPPSRQLDQPPCPLLSRSISGVSRLSASTWFSSFVTPTLATVMEGGGSVLSIRASGPPHCCQSQGSPTSCPSPHPVVSSTPHQPPREPPTSLPFGSCHPMLRFVASVVFSPQTDYLKNCFCKYLCEYFSIVFDNIQCFHDLVIAFAGVFKNNLDSTTEAESFFKKQTKQKQKCGPVCPSGKGGHGAHLGTSSP